ncbi:hypothetical protein MTY59_13150 [Mycobacterium senriense]|uniref:Uncharacterized protein n=1 Tax=Mycobacterium senriense TaxID=2775496 RepID=A0ABN6ICS8_9MYCO|nr:hypothetical protein MTY59_13150 [Mycobacterium senriense]
MSVGAVPFVVSEVFDATDSVVIIVLPEQGPAAWRPLVGDIRDTNHPVGRAIGRIRANPGLAASDSPSARSARAMTGAVT